MSKGPSATTGGWCQRPSLEYQHAFDFCAVEVHHAPGPIGVFASSAFYARELLKRLDGLEAGLAALGSWRSPAGDTGQWLEPEVAPGAVRTLEAIEPPLKAVVWAEPELKEGQQVLRRIGRLLRADAKLYVVVSDCLAAYLPEWQQVDRQPATRPAGLRRTRTWLRQEGFEVEKLWGFHGPRSIVWGYISQCMARLGREDWADRCHFQMRAQYVVSGWQATWTPVSVAVARRH